MDGASPIFKTANNVTKVNNSIMQQQVWEVGALAKPSSMPEKNHKEESYYIPCSLAKFIPDQTLKNTYGKTGE